MRSTNPNINCAQRKTVNYVWYSNMIVLIIMPTIRHSFRSPGRVDSVAPDKVVSLHHVSN
jgi:hypothetical protein|eukprot:SAG25_NODE_511_length_7294_cov_181.757192_2_plen_60_part_00